MSSIPALVREGDAIRAGGLEYPPGYRRRRFRNWFFLGLLYASYYLCRYNLSTVTPELAREFGLNNQQTGSISTGRDLGYMIGTFVNGLFADALGGKQSMALGALGTIVLNLLFGWWANWKWATADVGVLVGGLVLIRTLDGYGQAFGAPGMVKINTAWFRRRERGTFAGIFGAMIQLGQVGVNQLSGLLLAGFSIGLLGVTLAVPQQNWRIMFVVPPAILALVLVLMWLNVRNHPEQAGFVLPQEEARDEGHDQRLPLGHVFVTIASNPLIWLNAGAYLCTGFVRRAYDYWWAKYFDNVWQVGKGSAEYHWLGLLLPAAAVAGSFGAGVLSDKVFGSRRSPVAAALYGVESLVILTTIVLLGWGWAASPLVGCVCVTLISLTCNSSHSIIGTAAVMDIGGRKMAGFALGVVNSFQYVGAMLAGRPLGRLLDRDWDWLFWSMLPFSLLGMILMLSVWLRTRGRDVRGA